MNVGAVVIPKASVAVNRNYDFDFAKDGSDPLGPYRVSKPVGQLCTRCAVTDV